ncbi:hypothetical protein R3W88_022181 [Solanum pinnatisectum]|uniref:Uncharacterized protein n=1 Tax=Solanum pinnatisectum TaxID=50273 RepID=A0AAV9LUU9_9SOLN|nr:hypothetical protein R3W88_022181 [Solanum pinnatisectum]
MVQENNTNCEFIDGDDQSESWSKSINDSSSSCVTHECVTIEEISLEDEEKEADLKREKREELIQYYIKRNKEKKEAELIRKVEEKRKNEVCVDAIEHLYYLIPCRKRSKIHRESRYKCTSSLIVREENEFSDTVQDFEVPIIPKIESLSMITTEPIEKIQDFEVPIIPKIESLSVISEPIEKIQDFEVPVIPKIESLSVIPTEPIEKVQEKAEKIKKMVQFKRRNRVSQAVLPEELKNKIQELGVSISEVSLVIEKPLYSTDLSDKHMRLSIPVKQVVNPDEFLNAQEKEILDIRDSCNRMSKIKFNLIEPSLEICNIHLAKWSMNSSSSYVLLNDWMSVHQRNSLKVNMMVQLWFFRKDENRWLALVVVPDDQCSS